MRATTILPGTALVLLCLTGCGAPARAAPDVSDPALAGSHPASCTLAVDPALIDRIATGEDFFSHQPELMYLAMQNQPGLLRRLMQLVPMATRDDCTCCAAEPGDVAAVIVTNAFAADPKLTVLDDLSPEDRDAIIRYLDAVQPTDWSEETKSAILARFSADQ